MIRDIVKISDENGEEILSTKCKNINFKDCMKVAQDLIDTANYHNQLYKDGKSDKHCCGLAANQIGQFEKVIIAARSNNKWMIMINPILMNKHYDQIESTEGCMSMEGEKTVMRYQAIQVMYQDNHGRYKKELNPGPGKAKWRGSTNQRVIDVKESLKQGCIVEYRDFNGKTITENERGN